MQWAPRLVSLTVLLSVCCNVIPLPAGRRSPKDLSQPFPCQAQACGCRSADQCWKKCCCFTNSQKVAWAKAHKVQLPAAVVASAKRERLQEKLRAAKCCLSTKQKIVTKAPAGSEAKEQAATIYVIAALVQQCQGQPWFWSTLPWAIIPPVDQCDGNSPTVGARLALNSATSMAYCHRPPVPPPRFSADLVPAV